MALEDISLYYTTNIGLIFMYYQNKRTLLLDCMSDYGDRVSVLNDHGYVICSIIIEKLIIVIALILVNDINCDVITWHCWKGGSGI